MMIFSDDGVGMPEDINFGNPDSSGLTLLSTLSDQLQGYSQFQESEKGIQFKLQFPLD